MGARKGRNPRTVSSVLYRRAKFLKYTSTTSSSIENVGCGQMVVDTTRSRCEGLWMSIMLSYVRNSD
jgi:hypothetical protein